MKQKRLLIFILLVLSLCSVAKTNELDLFTGIGFSPLNQDVHNFIEEDIKGNEVNLKDFKGSWVLLNFWATWCGYCKMELPSLESLYLEFKNTNLKIAGIAIDQGNRRAVKKYIKKNHISLPIIHDGMGRISKNYDVASVPVHYLISPDQKIVGILRGAKDWQNSHIQNKLKELIKLKSVDFSNIANHAPEEEKLTPPQIEVTTQDRNLLVKLIWENDINRYQIYIPKVNLPEGVTYKNVSTMSEVKEGKNILTYKYGLIIGKDGTHQIGPIEASWGSIFGGKKQFTKHPGISVTKKTSSNSALIIITLCALIFISAFIIFMFVVLRRKKINQNSNSKIYLKEYMEELNRIKSYKIAGKDADYHKGLICLYKKVLSTQGEDTSHLGKLIEEISYGGKKLDTIEASNMEKKIINIIKPQEDKI